MLNNGVNILNNIPFCEPNIGELEKEYVNEAISSGWVGSKGEFIDKFEDKFAKYIGVDYAITCSSGTSALCLAYNAIGVYENTKVVVPDDTFIAPYNQARIFTQKVERVPVDDQTWTLNLNNYEDCVVTCVHLYGNPCDMGQVYKHKFTLIEDCCESLGSKYRGKQCGSFGEVSCFSFHSAKIITTGEGGIICTNSKEIANRVRHLKNQSMIEPYKHTGMGWNYRMTNIQAAMGLAQLKRIDELIDIKRRITKFYNENLDDKYIRQKDQKHSDVVKWANAYKLSFSSSEVRSALLQSHIETRPGFKGDNTIVFPSSTKLTQGDLEYVCRRANEEVNKESNRQGDPNTGITQKDNMPSPSLSQN